MNHLIIDSIRKQERNTEDFMNKFYSGLTKTEFNRLISENEKDLAHLKSFEFFCKD